MHLEYFTPNIKLKMSSFCLSDYKFYYKKNSTFQKSVDVLKPSEILIFWRIYNPNFESLRVFYFLNNYKRIWIDFWFVASFIVFNKFLTVFSTKYYLILYKCTEFG